MKRKLQICVISDVHLGTHGSHARELLSYLESIEPERLIINGDFIDAWQFRKKFFPREHLSILQKVINMSLDGCKVYYLTGNHDDILRKFSDMSMDNFHLRDQLVLKLNNQKHWFFHGDIYDASIFISPFLARLGGKGYDYLIRINRLINRLRAKFNSGPISFAHKVKKSVKYAVKYISDFESKAIQSAAEKGYDVVICGHIHQPNIKNVTHKGKSIKYLNSGDWVENLSSLEYFDGAWKLMRYNKLFLDNLKDSDEKAAHRFESRKQKRLKEVKKDTSVNGLLELFH